MASGSPRSSGGGIAQLIGQFNAVPDLEPEPEPAALAPSESTAAPGSVAELLQRVESDDAALSELDLSDVATYQVHAAANTRALAHGLRENTSLTVLALEGCEITDELALALAEALAHNETLGELSLRRNLLKGSGVEAIVDALARNEASALRVLELGEQRSGGRIGERVVQAFRRLFETNITLSRVGIALELPHVSQLQPFFGRNREIERRKQLGKRFDELVPAALKSEAQLLVEEYDADELIAVMDEEDLIVACEEVTTPRPAAPAPGSCSCCRAGR